MKLNPSSMEATAKPVQSARGCSELDGGKRAEFSTTIEARKRTVGFREVRSLSL